LNNVLVTGGSGFLATNLKKYRPEWVYISSKDCDLTDYVMTKTMIRSYKPSAILHLASKVGGIKDNILHQADFFRINCSINNNILAAAHECGVKRILSALSTCCFPNRAREYPFNEGDMFYGPPAQTNFSYAMTKRMLHAGSMAYRLQYGLDYSTFCPSNLYGPEDHYNKDISHFVPALISKVAKASNGDTLEFWGTGHPLRQQLYIEDLCKIIPTLLENHHTEVPLIVAPRENLSIREMVDTMVYISCKDLEIKFNGNMNGQHRKDGSNTNLLKLIGPFKFTKFEEGVAKTYKWYQENR